MKRYIVDKLKDWLVSPSRKLMYPPKLTAKIRGDTLACKPVVAGG